MNFKKKETSLLFHYYQLKFAGNVDILIKKKVKICCR